MRYEENGISSRVQQLSRQAVEELSGEFARIDEIAEANTAKVLAAFRKHRVSDSLFAGTTGYGYDDTGRDTLDAVYADVFKTEQGLVRIGFVNGTHAITAMLFAAARPGTVLLSATGMPYDTLQAAIGISGNYPGSLKYYGVEFRKVDLLPDGTPDYAAIAREAADSKVSAVTVQRSRGYSGRPSLSPEVIGKIAETVHSVNPSAAVVADNCYGEFVDKTEPTQYGADLAAGSLIKNPGGGIVQTGGYVVGRKDLVEAAAMRLTTPGIGGECGSTLGQNRLMYQGLFLAPHTVAQAMKTAHFCARLMELMGCAASPSAFELRHDIVQTVEFGTPEGLKRFCRGIQGGSPVDSFASPEPWDMPGYEVPVIMAAGTFIQGSSIELSADGPMTPPYRAYLQGGLTFEAGKLGVMTAASMLEAE